MTTQLSLYNGALRLIGERRLASTSEAREPRYALDEIYSEALDYCLEQSYWNFAMRAVQVDHEAGIDPAFGFQYAFEVPSDWLRTDAVSLSETFNPPLTNYTQEQAYWYANGTPLFVRYVSNHADYGLDLTSWPMTFVKYVEAHLAAEICERLTQNSSKHEGLRKLEARRKLDASTKDVTNEAARFKPVGSWVNSRGGFGPMQYRNQR